MRRELLTMTLAVGLLGAGCAAHPPRDPFMISRDTFFKNTKTIALLPLGVPDDRDDPDPVRATFENLLQAKLWTAGFTVVPPLEYEQIWKGITQQMGGYFDPVTGERDEAKLEAARQHARRELAAKSHADALLRPRLVVVPASFDHGQARWSGVSEAVGTGDFWEVLLSDTNTSNGQITGISLSVVIEDVNGAKWYANAGGIQLLAKLSYRSFKPVPRDALFADGARNAQAVDVALGPLAKGGTGPGAR